MPRTKTFAQHLIQVRINGILIASAFANWLFFNYRPLDSAAVRMVLVIQTRDLGDVVMATALIAPLRERFPRARIVLVTGEWARELAAHAPVDAVLPYHSDLAGNAAGKRTSLAERVRAIKRIIREAPDVVIDLRGDLGTVLAAVLSGAKHRADRGTWRWRDLWRNARHAKARIGISHDIHEVDIFLEIAGALGVTTERPQLQLTARPEELARVDTLLQQECAAAIPLVILHPGAATAEKMWPAENFAALANLIIAEYSRVRFAITGNGKERPLAQRIAAAMPEKPLDLCGELSLGELYALYTRSALWIGNDTGPMHMAAAASIPLVAIFMASRPGQFGPLTKRSLVISGRIEDGSGKHSSATAIRTLSADRLWPRVKEFMRAEQIGGLRESRREPRAAPAPMSDA